MAVAYAICPLRGRFSGSRRRGSTAGVGSESSRWLSMSRRTQAFGPLLSWQVNTGLGSSSMGEKSQKLLSYPETEGHVNRKAGYLHGVGVGSVSSWLGAEPPNRLLLHALASLDLEAARAALTWLG